MIGLDLNSNSSSIDSSEETLGVFHKTGDFIISLFECSFHFSMSSLENLDASIPNELQPPTPSAIPIAELLAKKASSAGFELVFGIICPLETNSYLCGWHSSSEVSSVLEKKFLDAES